MDAAMPMTITHVVLIWTLLGLLLTWMITFTVLALRPNTTQHSPLDEVPISHRAVPTSPPRLHVIASQPVPTLSRDSSPIDIGRTSLKL